VILPASARQSRAKSNDTKTAKTQLEIDEALARGAEPSENDNYKTLPESHRIVVEFNQRLKKACLMKSVGPSVEKIEKLKQNLKHQSISTTGGLVCENCNQTMARLDKLLQKYRLTYELDMIQKLEPIDARAYAHSKIDWQKTVANIHHKKFHNDQGASTNENATNRAMGEGIASGRTCRFFRSTVINNTHTTCKTG